MTGRVAPTRERTTIRPSGKPSWPMLLLAGTEKSGKSFEAAAFSGSSLIDRTFWIEVGEGEGHHYGAVPGARYELVTHDGSQRDILDAIRWAVWQPRGESGKPNAIVLDSSSILWDLLGEEQAVVARRRAAQKAANKKAPAPDPDDFTITGDQWRVAKRRWEQIIDALRHHDGPVIICARMDEVTVFDKAGQPTKERTWKIQTEKKLPFEVTGIVQLRGYRRAFVTGMRSLRMHVEPDALVPYPNFSLDKLMRDLGLDEETTAPRTYVAPRPEAYLDEYDAEAARLAEHRSDTREARRQAAQGQLPDSEEVGQAIGAAFQDEKDPRRALVRLRAKYGATVLAQVMVTTPWGSLDANTAIDAALIRVEAPAAQSQPTGPQGEPPNALPPGQPSPEAGAETPPLADGRQTSPEPAAAPTEHEDVPEHEEEPETDWEPEPEPAEAPRDPQCPTVSFPPKVPDKQSTSERARWLLDREAVFQAEVLRKDPLAHVADLLPAGATSVADVPGNVKLQTLIVASRPAVVAELIKAGMNRQAEEYVALGQRIPARNIADIITSAATAQSSF